MLGNVMLGNVIQACDPFISLEELSNNTEWLSWQHIITVTIIRQVTGVECTDSHYTMNTEIIPVSTGFYRSLEQGLQKNISILQCDNVRSALLKVKVRNPNRKSVTIKVFDFRIGIIMYMVYCIVVLGSRM